ncbi:MAG: response regulator [Rhodopila sp.]
MTPEPDGPGPMAWSTRVDADDDRAVRSELRRTLREPSHRFNCEYTVKLPDGTQRRLLARGQGIRDATNRVARIVGITMDVSARFEAEKARDALINLLQAERGRLSMIVDALPVGVGSAGMGGRFVLSNPALSRVTGVALPSKSAETAGRWIGFHRDGAPIAPEEYPGNRALLGETVLPGLDFLMHNADGTQRWLRVGAAPLQWEDGAVIEALIVIQNIDAERRLVDLERQANVRLEHRVREEVAAREAAQQRAAHAERVQALGQIAGGIAHDFNNVLQAVTGAAALIERRPDQPDRILRHARMIADAARRGAAITSRLLAFARRVDLRAESLDAAGLLQDMAEVLSHTLGGSLRCEVDAPANLPPLFADRGQLETVLVNLATNARDAMPSGGVLTFSARSVTVPAGESHPAGLTAGAYVRISVADTGSGMNTAVLARVTEPFFTTKEPGKGTGLGLAMAKGFVEQSEGRLSIESVEGKGTVVHLWLPQADGISSKTSPAATAPSPVPITPTVPLVDDDPIVRTVLTASLEDVGFSVTAVDSGSGALALLRKRGFDIMVTDLTMPGMDGLALIREVRTIYPTLPTVLLTGYAGDGAALAIGGAITGTFTLLRKPVTGVQLADRISSLLESARMRLTH